MTNSESNGPAPSETPVTVKQPNLLGLTGLAVAVVATVTSLYCVSRSHELAVRVSDLESAAHRQRKDFEDYRSVMKDAAHLGLLADKQKSAVFDGTTSGFVRVDSQEGLGFLLLALRQTTPHLDGVRLTFDVGNPLSVTFVGFEMMVNWGERYTGSEADSRAMAQWLRSLKKQNFAITQRLNPSSWTQVVIDLPGTQPQRLGHIQASIKLNRVAMVESASR